MKKTLFLLPILFLSSLVSCGGGSKPTPSPTPTPVPPTPTPVYHDFRFAGINCDINGKSKFEQKIEENKHVTFTININPDYALDKSDVKIEGDNAEFYFTTNQIVISKMTSDVNVIAIAKKVKKFTFTFSGAFCTINGKNEYSEEIAIGSARTYAIKPVSDKYFIPKDNVTWTGTGVEYKPDTNQIVINNMRSDVKVDAIAKLIGTYTIKFTGTECIAKTSKMDQPTPSFTTTTTDIDGPLEIQLFPSNKYRLPNDVEISFFDDTKAIREIDYTYDSTSGALKLISKANMSIVVVGVIEQTAAKLLVTVNEGETVNLNCHNLITVNWGDDEINTEHSHTYSSAGDYIISITGNLSSLSIEDGEHHYLKSIDFYTTDMSSLSEQAFYNCANLSYVGLPVDEKFVKINISAFANCTSLSSIYIPNNVTIIETSAFASSGLKYINFSYDSNLTTIKNNAFYATPLLAFNCPKKVSSIENNAFNQCAQLAKVDFSYASNLKIITNSTFYSCMGLKSIILPPNLTSIGNSAFCNCRMLSNIKIPHTVTKMEDQAFAGDRFLTEFDLSAYQIDDNVPNITNATFKSSNNVKFYVSSNEVKEAFINKVGAGWSAFKTRFIVLPN